MKHVLVVTLLRILNRENHCKIPDSRLTETPDQFTKYSPKQLV